jgi:hypothetical protein
VVQKDNPSDMLSPGLRPANGKSHIKGHLPVLVACAEHDESFAPFFKALNIETRASRRLRILVFIKLRNLTELSGLKYFKAWLDCLLCTWLPVHWAVAGN